MYLLIKLQFLLLFFLYSYFFLKLTKKGFSFSLGIVFATLYFVFIPMSIFLITDTLEISAIDFSNTNLIDITFDSNILESIIFILYLYSILIFVYFSEFFVFSRNDQYKEFPLNWKTYLFFTLLLGSSIFILAGILEGGNWYLSREHFFKENGLSALVLTYSFTAIKVIFLGSILTMFIEHKINFLKFILIVILFSSIELIMTGNRIYVFTLMASILIVLINRYKIKVFFFGLLIIPLGYVLSIYRHLRGDLFTDGVPSITHLIGLIAQIIEKDPPSIEGFLLGISESVNFNVIYEIFHYITFNNALWGETFLKAFVFFIPRSLWPEKPLSITQLAGEWFAPQSEHLSLVTTIIGEVHANFFLFGIVFLPLILFITDRFFKKIFFNSTFTQVLSFLIGILIFRMPYSDILLTTLFIFIFYKLILSYTSSSNNSTNSMKVEI